MISIAAQDAVRCDADGEVWSELLELGGYRGMVAAAAPCTDRQPVDVALRQTKQPGSAGRSMPTVSDAVPSASIHRAAMAQALGSTRRALTEFMEVPVVKQIPNGNKYQDPAVWSLWRGSFFHIDGETPIGMTTANDAAACEWLCNSRATSKPIFSPGNLGTGTSGRSGCDIP